MNQPEHVVSPQPTKPKLIFHVGDGLQRFTQMSDENLDMTRVDEDAVRPEFEQQLRRAPNDYKRNDAGTYVLGWVEEMWKGWLAVKVMTPSVGRAMVSIMMAQHAQKLANASQYAEMMFPEAMCNESTAALNVMTKLRQTIAEEDMVLSVATFSYSMFSAVLEAVVEAELHSEFLICLHPSEDSPEVVLSWLDKSSMLENWSYGVLHAQIDEERLRMLKFHHVRKLGVSGIKT